MSEDMNVLEEANGLVHGDRNESYGHPFHDFQRTAQMWSAILGVKVSAQHVPLCMIAVKLSRQCHKPKRDNLVDIAGYAETANMVEQEIDRLRNIQAALATARPAFDEQRSE